MKQLLLTAILFVALFEGNSQVYVNDELRSLVLQSFGFFPAIKETENFVAIAEQKAALAKTNDPFISADAAYTFIQPKVAIPFSTGPDNESKVVQFVPVHNISTGINANYMLFDFGRLKASLDRAKSDLQYAKDNADNARFQLAYQVVNIYYGIVYLRNAIIIEDTVLNYLSENKHIIESKLKNGDAIKLDLLSIQANIDAEDNRRIDLQNTLQKQINLLHYTTGVTTSGGDNFDFNTPIKQSVDVLGEAQTNAADFNLANDKILQAQSELEMMKLTDKPSVNLRGGAGFKNGYLPNIGDIRFNYMAGIAFNVPIYSGGRTKKQVQITQALVQQNQLSQQSLINTYKKDIDQALTDIATNIERIKNTSAQIALANEAKALAASRYINGVGTNLEITNAGTNIQKAAFSRLQYQYQLCLAKVELARLSGYKFW